MTAKSVSFASGTWQAGFTIIPNAVLLDSGLTPGAKTMYAMFVFYAREDESCYPGQDRLGDSLGVTPKTVRGYIGELTIKGLVEQRRRGLRQTNVYVIHAPEVLNGRNDRSGTVETDRSGAVETTDEVKAVEQDAVEQPNASRSLVVAEEARQLAAKLVDGVNGRGLPGQKVTVTNKTVAAIDRLHRLDSATWEQIEWVIDWLERGGTRHSDFWRTNIRSGEKLREHFAVMVERIRAERSRVDRRRDGMTETEHREAVLEGARRVDAMLGREGQT